MSKEKKLPNYIDIKFTKNQKLYFKQILNYMYSTCEKECYPMYFGFLESCLKSIIEGESKTLIKE